MNFNIECRPKGVPKERAGHNVWANRRFLDFVALPLPGDLDAFAVSFSAYSVYMKIPSYRGHESGIISHI